LISDCTLGSSLTEAIVHTHVFLISRHGDSLIARKGGRELSDRAAKIANQVYLAGNPGDEAYHEALADFDFWLRSDGNRRNPGTPADLAAAALFAGRRYGPLTPPSRRCSRRTSSLTPKKSSTTSTPATSLPST